jgi:alkylated DNA repair dioxygenase AlkB
MRMQHDLFTTDAPAIALPEGMRYEEDFLTTDEEASLLAVCESLPVQEMNYRGFTARRRVMSFGASYDFSSNRLQSAAALPRELEPVRGRAAAWLGVAPDAFTQVLVAEYREGTPLGWHRDVPDFEDVVGVSLLGEAVMRFRPWPPRDPKRADVLKLTIAPRSIYLLHGPSRWAWQHSVVPTRTRRWSITFRTPRAR